ncbi:MAG TPA: Spy/CpxP family protein refolding chaperone [Candidatus Aquilonibacter sp.]
MKLRVTLLAGLIAASLALPAVAQQQQQPSPPAQGQPGGQGGNRMMRMFDGLNLTDQQKSQIQTIMQNFRQAHPPGTPPDPAARKQLMDQINGVLTPDQRTKLQANMEKYREQHQGNDTTNPAPAPTATPI